MKAIKNIKFVLNIMKRANTLTDSVRKNTGSQKYLNVYH